MSLCAKLFGAAAIGWIATAGAAIGQAALTPVVHAPAGDLQGLSVAGVGEFLGIPYAEPPVGELRWRPPQAGGTLGGAAAGDEVRATPVRSRSAASSRRRARPRTASISTCSHRPPSPRPAREAPGHGVVPRRRPVYRREQRLRRQQARRPRPRRRGDAQLPRRRVGILLGIPRSMPKAIRSRTTASWTSRSRCAGCSRTSPRSAAIPAT